MSSGRLWATLALMSLAMVVGYVDRVNLSIAIALPDFSRVFHLTDDRRGILNSAFWMSYAAFQIPAGVIVDRFGTKYPFAVCFFLWSLASAAAALASSLPQFFLLRVILGACEAMAVPASLRWIRFNVPPGRYGVAFGVFTTGSKVGAIVGIPAATLLVTRFGWRGMFLALGVGGLLWLIPWLATVKNDSRPAAVASPREAPSPPLSFAVLLRSPAILGTIVGGFCYGYAVLFYFTWMPSYYVKRLGLSLGALSFYSTISFVGLAVIGLAAAWLMDRMIAGGRDSAQVSRKFVVAGLLSSGLMQILGLGTDRNGVALGFSIASLLCLGLVAPSCLALTQSLVPASSIGRTAALQNCSSNLAGAIVSIVSGRLLQATGSYVAPIVAIFGFLLIGVAVYVFAVQVRFSPAAKIAAPASPLGECA